MGVNYRSESNFSDTERLTDINEDCRKRDLEKLFGKYGSIKDIWIATYAPFYAFVGYKDRRDAEEGV